MKHLMTLAATSALCSMATDPNVALGTGLDPAVTLGAGGGTPAVDPLATPAPAPAPAPVADNPNVFTFRIPNTETDIGIDIAAIPAETRMDFLKKGLRDYITNAVNQANVRANKANAPFDAYDEAVKADPLQTAVAKPDGERAVPELIETAAAARKRLYDGEVRKQGEGDGRKRETVDPLTKLVTEAVVRELFAKRKLTDNKVKYTDITSEISKAGGGVKFLETMVAEKVAAGGDEKELRKFMDARYINPAKMMLGQNDTKATKDQSLF